MTSGNGNNAPSVIGSVPQNGKSIRVPPPVVKPPVLTHLIGGFVIQEGADPFPVEHPSFSIDALRRCRRQPVAQSPRISTKMEEFSSKELRGLQGGPMLTCELCGKVDSAHIFKGTKRFCSMLCAKRYNMSCTKRVGLYPPGRHTLENLNRSQRQNGEQKSLESKHKTEVGFERKPPPGAFSSPRFARGASQGSVPERRSVDTFNGGPALPKSPAAAGSPPSPPPPAAEGVGGWRRRLRPACLPTGPPAPRSRHMGRGECVQVHQLAARVLGDRRRVPLAGDRRAGPAAAEGGPPDGGHEHQAGPCAEDLRPDLLAERLLALLTPPHPPPQNQCAL
ncbi:polyhomeotic-like protein 2 [Gadus chalcogrammus]|uniref:polyhomeotic-like protein 2 n=1 Tax=Gadus chalcogrammus TaxID=1042646 RepID=UPI0024C335A1|nr:polyhomeotic-like protein 2 [Gadus chalcogrammus]XP_056452166.1 polyhomeotic-like protein 2 [Gadus chalcogrammus]